MVRKYSKKSDKGQKSLDVLKKAAAEVRKGDSIRNAAKSNGICRMTLKRFISTTNRNNTDISFGYQTMAVSKMVLSREMETDLARHVKDMAKTFYGLTSTKCRILAFDFAKKNGIRVPESWERDKKAGKDWFTSFKRRHHLSCRVPEATSLARATAFNQHTVAQFFENISSVQNRYTFAPEAIFNLDETGVTTVQKPKQVLTEQGLKQVGAVTSSERGQLVTVVCAINAAGAAVPPMLIFPRVNFRSIMLHGAPTGAIGAATKSGWITEEKFLEYLAHLIKFTRCSMAKPILLILDNHESHMSLRVVEHAKENGVVIVTLPPHTSHRLQPLDKAVFYSFKSEYNKAMDEWMRSNPGRSVTIYEVAQFVGKAHLSSMVPRNIISGFRSTGIYPLNPGIFSDEDFIPANVTDRPNPTQAGIPSEAFASTSTSGVADRPNHIQPDIAEVSIASTSRFNQPPLLRHRDDEFENTVTNQTPPRDPPSLNSSIYVTPAEVLPVPKAGERKGKARRKRGRTTILTSTPEITRLVGEKSEREQKRAAAEVKKATLKKRRATKVKRMKKANARSGLESSSGISDIE